MKRFLAAFAATTCIAVAAVGSTAFAQAPASTMMHSRVPVRAPFVKQPPLPAIKRTTVPASKVSSQQKAASDQAMAAALPQLEAASSAMQSGNKAQTLTDLAAAIRTMNGAMDIYYGHRGLSMLAASDAYNALNRNETRQTKAIAYQISAAIRENKAASSVK